MIWMTALAAPDSLSAHGGFVSIDMLQGMVSPPWLRTALIIALLLLAGVVLVKLLELAIQFFERGFRTYTAAIRLPWDPTEKLKRALGVSGDAGVFWRYAAGESGAVAARDWPDLRTR
ncbi:MAG: hypothetical protein R3E95_10830 [Thiolinea sp.]